MIAAHPTPTLEHVERGTGALRLLPWLAIQLAALSLAAARVPLWARHPQMGEVLAAQYVLAAQLFGAAVLFPWLMRDARISALVVLYAVPMLLLAGALAGERTLNSFAMVGMTCSWLLALAVWLPLLRRLRLELLGPPLATTVLLLIPLLKHLRVD